MDKRERDAANRLYYTSRGICGKCGKRPVEPGRLKCFECLEADREAHKRMMERKTPEEKAKIAERHAASKRRLTAYRQEHGLCTQCGKPVVPGKRLCIDHLVARRQKKDKRWNNDIPREMRPEFGVCWCCGKRPIVHGKTLCEKCFDVRSKAAKKRSENPSPDQVRAREEYKKMQRRLNNIDVYHRFDRES